MKKILLFIALALSISAYGKTKTPIMGFWGLNFGMTKSQVHTVIKDKVADKNLDKLNKDLAASSTNSYFFMNVDFAGNVFDTSLLDFSNKGKLKAGLFKKGYAEAGAATPLFSYLQSSLTDKYGKPKEDGSSQKVHWVDGSRTIELDILQQGDTYFVSVFYFTHGFPDVEIPVNSDL